jgi:hypothetical protein
MTWAIMITDHDDGCDSGKWSSFGSNDRKGGDEENDGKGEKNAKSSKALMTSGNASAVSIGDPIVIQRGTKTDFDNLAAQYPPGADVTLAVINQAKGLDKISSTPVVGFAGFRITVIQFGSDKYIQGHFIQNTTTAGASGVGAYFGTYTPPRLAQ